MKWSLAILGAVAIAGLSTLGFRARELDMTFVNLAEARSRLADAGYYCTTDRLDGTLATGFLLSREPAQWNEAGALRKIGAMGSQWHGKAWVTFSSPLWQLQTLPENAGLRVWGKVIVFGDENLLREIDDLSR
jgi:hypothetical protein